MQLLIQLIEARAVKIVDDLGFDFSSAAFKDAYYPKTDTSHGLKNAFEIKLALLSGFCSIEKE